MDEVREYFAEKGIEVAGFVQWQPYGGGGAIDPETGVPEVPGLPNPKPNPNTSPNPNPNPNPTLTPTRTQPQPQPNPNPNFGEKKHRFDDSLRTACHLNDFSAKK